MGSIVLLVLVVADWTIQFDGDSINSYRECTHTAREYCREHPLACYAMRVSAMIVDDQRLLSVVIE